MEVLAEAGAADGDRGHPARAATRVVVLVGLGLGGEHDAYWLIRTVRERFPSHAILGCGANADPTAISRALFMGADGFVDKNIDPVEFLQALRRAADREMVLAIPAPPRRADRRGHRARRESTSSSPNASGGARRRRRGLTAREIAARLGVRERTVTTHLARIYGKLGVGQPPGGEPARGPVGARHGRHDRVARYARTNTAPRRLRYGAATPDGRGMRREQRAVLLGADHERVHVPPIQGRLPPLRVPTDRGVVVPDRRGNSSIRESTKTGLAGSANSKHDAHGCVTHRLRPGAGRSPRPARVCGASARIADAGVGGPAPERASRRTPPQHAHDGEVEPGRAGRAPRAGPWGSRRSAMIDRNRQTPTRSRRAGQATPSRRRARATSGRATRRRLASREVPHRRRRPTGKNKAPGHGPDRGRLPLGDQAATGGST